MSEEDILALFNCGEEAEETKPKQDDDVKEEKSKEKGAYQTKVSFVSMTPEEQVVSKQKTMVNGCDVSNIIRLIDKEILNKKNKDITALQNLKQQIKTKYITPNAFSPPSEKETYISLKKALPFIFASFLIGFIIMLWFMGVI